MVGAREQKDNDDYVIRLERQAVELQDTLASLSLAYTKLTREYKSYRKVTQAKMDDIQEDHNIISANFLNSQDALKKCEEERDDAKRRFREYKPRTGKRYVSVR